MKLAHPLTLTWWTFAPIVLCRCFFSRLYHLLRLWYEVVRVSVCFCVLCNVYIVAKWCILSDGRLSAEANKIAQWLPCGAKSDPPPPLVIPIAEIRSCLLEFSQEWAVSGGKF